MVNEVNIAAAQKNPSPKMRPVADGVLAGEQSLKIASRTVQWRIDISSYRQCPCSTNFKLGNRTWCLKLTKRPDRNKDSINNYCIYLMVMDFMNNDLHATFALRIAHSNMTWQSCFSAVSECCFRMEGDAFQQDLYIQGKYVVIEVEFLDLKIIRHMNGKKLVAECNAEGPLSLTYNQYPLKCLSRMFTESIFTDVTINTKTGTLSCHKAVLAAASPVFNCMLNNDFKEKSSSTIDIPDMALESCKALLSFLYGNIREEELWVHRVPLLEAAHKYEVKNLQNMCEERLLEDINSSNVIERLEQAHFYQLAKLKKGCYTYLFDLGKVHAITDAFSRFVVDTNKELAKEVIEMLLANAL